MGKEKDQSTTEKENNKVIEWGKIHFGDIKGALQRSSNDKEGSWKY